LRAGSAAESRSNTVCARIGDRERLREALPSLVLGRGRRRAAVLDASASNDDAASGNSGVIPGVVAEDDGINVLDTRDSGSTTETGTAESVL
jgi:hypothetical protein